MQKVKFIYCPFPSLEEAKQVAKILLQDKLVACVNILPGAVSLYSWKDSIQEEDEVISLFKTTENQIAKAVKRLEEIHSYQTPAILVLPVEVVNAAFADWVSGEVG